MEDVSIAIRPVRAPRPPILVAATGDRMVRRAAALADAWSAFGHGTLDTLVRQTGLYREALADAGKPFPPERFRVSKELYVAATREQARAECFPYIRAKYDAYRDWGQDTVLPPGESFEGSMAELTSGRFIIGSPDDCLEAIAEHYALLGFRDFCFRLHYPGMPHAQVMRSLDLFAERVLPEVRKL